MRIRYHNQSKKITALDAPEWMGSSEEQTVVEVEASKIPTDPISNYRFGSIQEPFVDVKNIILAEMETEKNGKKAKRDEDLALLGWDKQKLKAVKRLINSDDE